MLIKQQFLSHENEVEQAEIAEESDMLFLFSFLLSRRELDSSALFRPLKNIFLLRNLGALRKIIQKDDSLQLKFTYMTENFLGRNPHNIASDSAVAISLKYIL